jgi:hypothetical protein
MGNSTAIDPPLSADPTTNGGRADGDPDDLVAALMPTPGARPPDRTGERAAPEWEYRTELLEHGFLGWGSEQVDLRKLQERLDTLGPEGWELVHVSWNHRVRRKHGGHLLIFKRPKPLD